MGDSREVLQSKCITFRLVEKVLHNLRVHYSVGILFSSLRVQELGFDQGENILREVRAVMQVDPITLLEREKVGFMSSDGRQGFGAQLTKL